MGLNTPTQHATSKCRAHTHTSSGVHLSLQGSQTQQFQCKQLTDLHRCCCCCSSATPCHPTTKHHHHFPTHPLTPQHTPTQAHTCCKAHDARCADVDDLRLLLEQVVEHPYRQAQRQQQRGRLVKRQLEAQDIHNLLCARAVFAGVYARARCVCVCPRETHTKYRDKGEKREGVEQRVRCALQATLSTAP